MLLGTSFVHILRDQNVLANKLANWGVGLSSVMRSQSFLIRAYRCCLFLLYCMIALLFFNKLFSIIQTKKAILAEFTFFKIFYS